MRKVEKISVQCNTCNKEFGITPSKYKWSTSKGFYCCMECKLKGTERKVKTNCACCGIEIFIHKSQFERTKNNHCSPECRYKAQNTGIVKNCAHCGKETYVEKFSIVKSENHFCNAKCRGLYSRKRVMVNCAHCGKEIERHCSRVENYDKQYCNSDCYHKYLIGENNYNWLGGLSFLPYSPDFNSRLKSKIRKRDNGRCQICGAKNRRLNVHHRDYNKWNNEHDNLILLCNPCHSKTNYNREIWERYFKSSGFWFRQSLSKI